MRAVPPASGGKHESRLGEADLERERLHRLTVDAAGVGEHRKLVAGERGVGEDVDDDVAERRHRGTLPDPVHIVSAVPQAIVVSDLTKSYGNIQALRGVSFDVAEGEVFGLLGPNGAGKTTTVEILEGYRRRDGGNATVLGLDPGNAPRALRERVGVVLQQSELSPLLTVRETHRMFAGYFANPRDVDEVIELVGLAEKHDARVKSLSGGQKRRLDLGIALVGNPELVFLDEPTTASTPRRDARRGS